MNTYKLMEKDMYSIVGLIGLLYANSILGFAPQFLLVGLTAIQGSMFINSFIDNKWRKIFINLGCYSAEKKTPQLIKKEKNDLGDRYIFSIPNGLCLSDFEKVQEELEIIMQKPLKLGITNDCKLVMQISDIKYKEVYKPNKEVYNEISSRNNNNNDR